MQELLKAYDVSSAIFKAMRDAVVGYQLHSNTVAINIDIDELTYGSVSVNTNVKHGINTSVGIGPLTAFKYWLGNAFSLQAWEEFCVHTPNFDQYEVLSISPTFVRLAFNETFVVTVGIGALGALVNRTIPDNTEQHFIVVPTEKFFEHYQGELSEIAPYNDVVKEHIDRLTRAALREKESRERRLESYRTRLCGVGPTPHSVFTIVPNKFLPRRIEATNWRTEVPGEDVEVVSYGLYQQVFLMVGTVFSVYYDTEGELVALVNYVGVGSTYKPYEIAVERLLTEEDIDAFAKQNPLHEIAVVDSRFMRSTEIGEEALREHGAVEKLVCR